MFLAAMSTDNAFNSLKIFLFSSAFSTNGAIVIKPLTLKCGSFATSRTSFSTSSVLRPNFDSSHATLTSIRISEMRFFFSLSFSIASARCSESTECMRVARPTTYFTLFV